MKDGVAVVFGSKVATVPEPAIPMGPDRDTVFAMTKGIDQNRDAYSELDPLATDEDREIAAFRALWPVVSARLGLNGSPEPYRIFRPGRVFYEKAPFGRSLAVDMWRAFLDRHTAGDNGERYDLDELNAAAIAAGRGEVASRFILDVHDQARFPQARFMPVNKYHIDVVTALGPGGPVTRLSVGHTTENGR